MKKNEKFLEAMISIEKISAKEAGTIVYMPNALVQANLPYKEPKSNEYERRNGSFKLSLSSHKDIGLPYGIVPRLLMIWLTTEVVIKKGRELILGDSFNKFMKNIRYQVSGGKNGTINNFKEQTKRFFSSTIIGSYDDKDMIATSSLILVSRTILRWEINIPHEEIFEDLKILLDESLFNELIEKAVPIDMRAVDALRSSPMALDIYIWLTYRMSYLKRRSPIPWKSLQDQCGSEYCRLRDFKRAFSQKAKMVSLVYPQARFDIEDKFLILRPSPTHVSKSVNKTTYPRINSRG